METGHTEFVLLRGQLCLYAAKAPFPPSGCSIKGAIEYDVASDRMRCHQCGEFYSLLRAHLPYCPSGPISALDYRKAHGLLLHEPLSCLPIRRLLSAQTAARQKSGNLHSITLLDGLKGAARVAERRGKSRFIPVDTKRNERGNCQVQIPVRLNALAHKLGRTWTLRDLRAERISLWAVFTALNVRTLSAAQSLMQLQPTRRGGHGGQQFRFTQPYLLERLRDFFVEHGRCPEKRDCALGLLPDTWMFKREFGSWEAALEAAGLARVAA